MNTWGEKLKITLFGESHGPSIGVVVDGLKAGTPIDEAYIASELARRAPGQGEYSTARKETDKAHILSGVKDGYATGAPITCVIYNENMRSADYDSPLRPGHADWTGLSKYGSYMERSGGGRFSGRLTAPLVFAGAIAKSALSMNGIRIYGRIRSIGNMCDDMNLTGTMGEGSLSEFESTLKRISSRPFPALEKYEKEFRGVIATAKGAGDSVGGTIEVTVFGAPAGLGEPFFDSVESTLSSLYFSVPAVKGVEFGKGFDIAKMRGSEANDPISLCGGKIISETNHNGGVLGGISNGMPIIARVAVKPTASIAKPQRTVEPTEEKWEPGGVLSGMKETEFTVRGRHDPSIVPRAVPVMESVTAIGLLDLYYRL